MNSIRKAILLAFGLFAFATLLAISSPGGSVSAQEAPAPPDPGGAGTINVAKGCEDDDGDPFISAELFSLQFLVDPVAGDDFEVPLGDIACGTTELFDIPQSAIDALTDGDLVYLQEVGLDPFVEPDFDADLLLLDDCINPLAIIDPPDDAGLLVPTDLLEGLTCTIVNVFTIAEPGDEGTITVTKDCIGEFPFVPDTFEVRLHFTGDLFGTPIDATDVLGDVVCDTDETFFIPLGALFCDDNCDDFVATLEEVTPDGVAATFGGVDCEADGTITNNLDAESGVACTIFNTFNAATLTLTKDCGDDTESTFTVGVTGVDVAFDEEVILDCDGTPVDVNLPGGTFQLSEDAPGFLVTFDGPDCTAAGVVVATLGDVLACTITNTPVAPAVLSLNKVCDDAADLVGTFDIGIDEIGNGFSGSESLTCDGAAVDVELPGGTYQLSEDTVGFDAAFAGSGCTANGVAVLVPGDAVACTITNTAEVTVAPTITVNKVCGGDAFDPATTFTISIDGPAIVPDAPIGCGSILGPVEVSDGAYTVSEEIGGPDVAGFSTTIGCVVDGVLTIGGDLTVGAGDDAFCTVTNTFDDPEIPGEPVDPDDGAGGGDNNNTNENTNIINVPIDIENELENENELNNVNDNTLLNDNFNNNVNENTLNQDQNNVQDQDNTNDQNVNVNSSPNVNIDFGDYHYPYGYYYGE